MADRQFGPYRLVHQIAVGGMAEIHLAKAHGIAGFEKYVALKMIHPNFSQDQQFIQMLIDEAKITVHLQHVNVAQTFDLGRVDDQYYITMEFVDGADLYKLLRRAAEANREVPIAVAAYIAKEVATGLDYAHRKRDVSGRALGIVHRDVSPQNVLISHAGEVKIVDFGIAKASMRARQTQAGVIKGKYYYMSPEQAWGESLDHRTDIFSTGILLYEMLTGQMLYLEEDLHRLLEMVRKADIASPTTLRPDIPPQLEHIVMHALSKRPDDRYPNAGDLATDLERFLHAYSPVFTATKVAQWLTDLLGAPVPVAPAVQPPAAVGKPLVRPTRRFTRDQIIRTRDEFVDEHSVIRAAGGDDSSTYDATNPAGLDDRLADPPTPEPDLPPPPRPARRAMGEPARAVIPARPRSEDEATRAQELDEAPTLRPSKPYSLGRASILPPKARTGAGPSGAPRSGSPPLGGARAAGAALAAARAATPPTGTARAATPPLLTNRPVTPAPVRARAAGPLPGISAPARPLPSLRARAASAANPAAPRAVAEPTRRVDERDRPDASVSFADVGDEHTQISGPPILMPPPARGVGESTRIDLARVAEADTPPATSRPDVDLEAVTQAIVAPSPRTVDDETRTSQAVTDDEISDTAKGFPADGASEDFSVDAAGSFDVAAPLESEPTQISAASGDFDGEIATQLGPPTALRQPSWEAAPALAASVQKPAVSELRPPRQSRRTPAEGLELGPPPTGAGPSVLSALLAPDAPPHQVALAPPVMTRHDPGPAPLPMSYPVMAQPVNTFPNLAPQPMGFPYGPTGLPSGAPPQSYTGQLAALELDEIPDQYKIGRGRWLSPVRIAFIALLLAGAAAIILFLIYGNDRSAPPTTAVVQITSIPSGATVSVDGHALPEKTPTTYSGPAGVAHKVVIDLPGYVRWQADTSGNDQTLVASLPAITASLKVTSTPPDAEVLINNAPRGQTPLELKDLDPSSTQFIEIRLKGFRPVRQRLEWAVGVTEKSLDFVLTR